MLLFDCSAVRRPFAVLVLLLGLLGLTLLPVTSAAASGTSAASTVPGMPSPCWATHYGAEIPPGSYTASGEIFDENALTAATSLSLSPQLPFGTMVTVTNTANGASVTVRINDRGTFAATPSQPFCIDLTDGAFRRIGAISPDPGHFVVNVDPASGDSGGTPPGGPTGATGPVRGAGGTCVDVNAAGTADGTAVQLYQCNGTGAQSWTVASDGTLRALGKCLDVSGGSTADGSKVQLWTCNGTGAQQWRAGSGNLLVNTASGKCLDATDNSTANLTRLQIWQCFGGSNQQWILPA
ncbi:lectin [Streptomyces sp. NBC_01497]|uniref:lectin n=1 Tax=Streptomyces sp. NBC_01497 TaxID=2903885 RepID=UPI003FCD910F